MFLGSYIINPFEIYFVYWLDSKISKCLGTEAGMRLIMKFYSGLGTNMMFDMIIGVDT
ncbi:hypothetical protein HanIR_Chr04g0172691 [Helianthus annuus]|nr:hypothetical protein HanIR_Chr04g0172691 [Helianthus annuus]